MHVLDFQWYRVKTGKNDLIRYLKVLVQSIQSNVAPKSVKSEGPIGPTSILLDGKKCHLPDAKLTLLT